MRGERRGCGPSSMTHRSAHARDAIAGGSVAEVDGAPSSGRGRWGTRCAVARLRTSYFSLLGYTRAPLPCIWPFSIAPVYSMAAPVERAEGAVQREGERDYAGRRAANDWSLSRENPHQGDFMKGWLGRAGQRAGWGALRTVPALSPTPSKFLLCCTCTCIPTRCAPRHAAATPLATRRRRAPCRPSPPRRAQS